MITKGWVVWRDKGVFPNVIHDNFASAKSEAERLAKKEFDVFFIYEINRIGMVRIKEPQTEFIEIWPLCKVVMSDTV